MQDLITYIKQGSADCLQSTLNVITYDPLPDTGEERLPRRREYSTHPEFRPTVKKCRLEPHENNLEYSELVELYGYDEDRGLLKLVLVEGTMIEAKFKNEDGEPMWVKGRVSSTTEGSLKFEFKILGDLNHYDWERSRADMESTWRLPPATRIGQLGVDAMRSTKGYTPWHHPSHGSHWLRLQPRGAWKYKTHDVRGRPQEVTFGWRLGLPIGQPIISTGGHDFTMSSFVEDHMSKEDLAVGATTQEWSALKKLGLALRRWDNLSTDSLGNGSRVPPGAPGSDPRPRGRKNKGRGIPRLGPSVLPPLDPGIPVTQSAGTCLSGCTLLASPSGGIPMREIRAGTTLLNSKGRRVKVTHVYFSRESSVMVQISANCHTTPPL